MMVKVSVKNKNDVFVISFLDREVKYIDISGKRIFFKNKKEILSDILFSVRGEYRDILSKAIADNTGYDPKRLLELGKEKHKLNKE